MALTDLHSHKIHSSVPDWHKKVVTLACILKQFDDKPYDRNAIEYELRKLSQRSILAPRDVSKYRDEFSAYSAYLGMFYVFRNNGKWQFKLSETAKRFLCNSEPDVGSYCRLQLPLFQFPNGSGVQFHTRTASAHVVHNALKQTLGYIKNGIRVSPFRLAVKLLLADAESRNVPLEHAQLSFETLYSLANQPYSVIANIGGKGLLQQSQAIKPPKRFERRFHTFEQTELIRQSRGHLIFDIEGASPAVRALKERQIRAIAGMRDYFKLFEKCNDDDDIIEIVSRGSWGRYFDAVLMYSPAIVDLLSRSWTSVESPSLSAFDETTDPIIDTPVIMSLEHKERRDPEVERLARQRRNLSHQLLVNLVQRKLVALGSKPKHNEHIDLYGEIPKDGKFLFEMKTFEGDPLDQIRLGISQLYEYKFRFRNALPPDVELCLVLEKRPESIPWLEKYICEDRGIRLCWSDGDRLIASEHSLSSLRYLVACKDAENKQSN